MNFSVDFPGLTCYNQQHKLNFNEFAIELFLRKGQNSYAIVPSSAKRSYAEEKCECIEVKDVKVVDFVSELFVNLFAGESKYPPETPQYKITIGFLNIVDSILKVLNVDIFKITKVSSSTSELVESLLYNPKFDSYKTDLKIFDYIVKESDYEKLEFRINQSSVKKSKKGFPIILVLALILIIFLPVWILILLFGYISNQIKFGKKMK